MLVSLLTSSALLFGIQECDQVMQRAYFGNNQIQTIMDKFTKTLFISVQYTFSDFRCLPPSPLINVGHELVHFQSCTLFLLYFPPKKIETGGGGCKRTQNVSLSSSDVQTLKKKERIRCIQKLINNNNNNALFHISLLHHIKRYGMASYIEVIEEFNG